MYDDMLTNIFKVVHEDTACTIQGIYSTGSIAPRTGWEVTFHVSLSSGHSQLTTSCVLTSCQPCGQDRATVSEAT